MKGAKLIITFFLWIVVALASIMTILGTGGNYYPSWSQFARTYEEPLLLATLPAIFGIYLIRSFTFNYKDRVLYRFKKLEVRIEHLNRFVALFFWMIIWTPVTIVQEVEHLWWIETLHITATFLGIIFIYLEIGAYYKKGSMMWWGYSSVAIAALGMLGGLWFKIWTVGMGEFVALLPATIYLLITNKDIKT